MKRQSYLRRIGKAFRLGDRRALRKRVSAYWPWAVLFFVAVLFVFKFNRVLPQAPFDLAMFSRLPVVHNGRIKPIDTVARSLLLSYGARGHVSQDKRRIVSSQFLLDALSMSSKADSYRIFRLEHPGIFALLGASFDGIDYFSFKSLSPYLHDIEEQGAQADQLGSRFRTPYQRAIIALRDQLVSYVRLKNTVQIEGRQNFLGDLSVFEGSIDGGLRKLDRRGAQKVSNSDSSKDLDHLLRFFKEFQFLSDAAIFLVVPPFGAADKLGEWESMGAGLLHRLHSDSFNLGVTTYAKLMASYQTGDSELFNSSLKLYYSELETSFSRLLRKVEWEVRFNSFGLFFKLVFVYAFVVFLFFISWLRSGRRGCERAAYYLLVFGFAMQTMGIVFRIWVQGRPPVTNLYSSALFVGWVAIFAGLVLERRFRKGIGTMAAAVIGLITLVIAHRLHLQGDTMEMLQAVLDSNIWLATHVVMMVTGYAAAFLTGFIAIIYLVKGIFTKSLDKRTAADLTKMVFGCACFTLLFSFIGTVLGGIWADQSWGRFWGWDPKENGALLIILWFGIILHAWIGGYIRQRGLMIMAVFGNILTSFSWWGVNMLGVGLHSYGFMDGSFLTLVLFMFSQLVFMWLGTLPKRYWRSG